MTTTTSARAQTTFTSNGLFASQALSEWAAGPGFAFDTGQQLLGEQWSLGKDFGGITETCVFGVCAKFGAEIGASTNGKVGLDYQLNVNGGTFGVRYAGDSLITVPTSVPVLNGGPGQVTLATNFIGQPGIATNTTGGRAVTTLQVTGPTVQADLGIEAQAHAFAGATVCVAVCSGPAFGPFDIDHSQNIITVNPNNSGTLTVLGNTVSANSSVSALGGLLHASVQLPSLDGSSVATPAGNTNGILTSTQRSPIAAVSANIAQIAADGSGLAIPLSGKIGPYGYNLLQTNAGLALDLSQTIRFTPDARGKLLFSAAVQPVINGIIGAASKEIDFKYGDQVSFLPGKLTSVSFTPVTDLRGAITNTTSLVVNGNIAVKALGLDIAGLQAGPLIDASLPPSSLGAITLATSAFSDDIDTVSGAPITMNFNCGGVQGTGEFRDFTVCASSKFIDEGPYVTVGNVIEDLIDVQNCTGYTYSTITGDPGQNCTTRFDHYSAPFVHTRDGTVDISSSNTLGFTANDPAVPGTDAGDLATLAALGYTSGAPAFDIPLGAPLDSFGVLPPVSDVAEPGMIASFVLATWALARTRRRPSV